MKLTKEMSVAVSLNAAFALNVLFGQSVLSLLFLFSIFVISIALVLHMVYMAVNNDSQKVSAKQEGSYEEVSTQFILQSFGAGVQVYYELYD